MSDPVNEIMNSEDPPTIDSTNTIVIEETVEEEEPAVGTEVPLTRSQERALLLKKYPKAPFEHVDVSRYN